MAAREALALWLLCAAPALAGGLDGNPVAAAARAIGAAGIAPGAAGKTPVAFRPLGRRVFLEAFLEGVTDDPTERAAFKDALLEALKGHETQARAGGYADDVAGALAFAVCVLQVAATGQALPDQAFAAVLGQLRAALDQPAVRAATDEQKQTFYEACLYYGGAILTLNAAGGEARAEQLRVLARSWLEELLGAPAARIALGATGLTITGARPAAAAPEVAAPGGLAAGFGHGVPEGWKLEANGWYVQRHTDPQTGGITAAHVRLPPAIPAQGNMGDALRQTWKAVAPPELQAKVSGMVYRRWVGDGLFAQFVTGRGREQGRHADTLCTLYLIDCGPTWQPLLVAQTYENPGSAFPSSVEIAGDLSFGASADLAERFLTGLRCPAGQGKPFADPASLVGHYQFGSTSTLQWVEVHTGATGMTVAAGGGELRLEADGSFTYQVASTSGQVGRLKTVGQDDAGRWSLKGDLLVLAGKLERRYRLAGLTVFPGGVKAAILLSDLDRPVNAVTVSLGGNIYSTRKQD